MGAGAEVDLGARLPDCAATGPAHNTMSARTATTLKLEAKICKTGRWFVMVINPGPKAGVILAAIRNLRADLGGVLI